MTAVAISPGSSSGDELVEPLQRARPGRRPAAGRRAGAWRSCAVTAAAPRPWPATSPSTTESRPLGSSTRSYQSPPTTSLGARRVAGRERDAGHLRQLLEQQGALQRRGEPALLARRRRGRRRRGGAASCCGRGDLVRPPRRRRRRAPSRVQRANDRRGLTAAALLALDQLGGVRVAAPVDLAQRLGAEPREEVARPPRRPARRARRWRVSTRSAASGQQAAAERSVDRRRRARCSAVDQRADPLGRRGAAEQPQPAVEADGGAGGGQQVEQR